MIKLSQNQLRDQTIQKMTRKPGNQSEKVIYGGRIIN